MLPHGDDRNSGAMGQPIVIVLGRQVTLAPATASASGRHGTGVDVGSSGKHLICSGSRLGCINSLIQPSKKIRFRHACLDSAVQIKINHGRCMPQKIACHEQGFLLCGFKPGKPEGRGPCAHKEEAAKTGAENKKGRLTDPPALRPFCLLKYYACKVLFQATC